MTRFAGRLAARLMLVLVVLQAAGAVHPALARVGDAGSAAAREAAKPTLLAHAGAAAAHAERAAPTPAKPSTASTSPTIIMLLAGFGLMAFIARRRTRAPGEEDQ